MEKSKLIKIVIAGVLLIVAVVLIAMSLMGGDSNVRIDEETGERIELPTL